MKQHRTLIIILFGLCITNCSSPTGSDSPPVTPPDEFESIASVDGNSHTVTLFSKEELTLGFYQVVFLVQNSETNEVISDADMSILPKFTVNGSLQNAPASTPVPVEGFPGFYAVNLYLNSGSTLPTALQIDITVESQGAAQETISLVNFDIAFNNIGHAALATDNFGREYLITLVSDRVPLRTDIGILEKHEFGFSLHQKLGDGSFAIPAVPFTIDAINCSGSNSIHDRAFCLVRLSDAPIAFSPEDTHYKGELRYNAGGPNAISHNFVFDYSKADTTLVIRLNVLTKHTDL